MEPRFARCRRASSGVRCMGTFSLVGVTTRSCGRSGRCRAAQTGGRLHQQFTRGADHRRPRCAGRAFIERREWEHLDAPGSRFTLRLRAMVADPFGRYMERALWKLVAGQIQQEIANRTATIRCKGHGHGARVAVKGALPREWRVEIQRPCCGTLEGQIRKVLPDIFRFVAESNKKPPRFRAATDTDTDSAGRKCGRCNTPLATGTLIYQLARGYVYDFAITPSWFPRGELIAQYHDACISPSTGSLRTRPYSCECCSEAMPHGTEVLYVTRGYCPHPGYQVAESRGYALFHIAHAACWYRSPPVPFP